MGAALLDAEAELVFAEASTIFDAVLKRALPMEAAASSSSIDAAAAPAPADGTGAAAFFPLFIKAAA